MKTHTFAGDVLRCAFITLVLLTSPIGSYGSSDLSKQSIDKNLDRELVYLLGFVGAEAADSGSFSAEKISGLLEFVAQPKDETIIYHADTINGAASAYHEIDIEGEFETILRLTYNQEIPSPITMPSTLRLSYWKSIDTPDNKLPNLWEMLPCCVSPLFVTGIEHIVNSPDYSSGAYFEYDLYRTLIALKHEGRNVLISISKQVDISDVGKKGIVIGPDENWDYVYTGVPGVNKNGLGWVKSYMYDSYSVTFYYELDADRPKVRFSGFKWVSAGFGGINLARTRHIHSGMIRFSRGFKQILENPRVAETPAIEMAWKRIKTLPNEKLRQITRNHLAELERKCSSSGMMSDKQVAALFVDEQYLNTLDREQMQAMLLLEHLKKILNGQPPPTLSYLPSSAPNESHRRSK